VVKHARASSATVRIAATDDTVSIEVSDDGRGFDPAAVGPDHFGLRSMRGRVADLGGRLDITSAPAAAPPSTSRSRWPDGRLALH
jgi:signal transduction histidine kinase